MKRKISLFFFILFIFLIPANLSYAGYFLVWEPAFYPSSGILFKSCLDSLGYSGEYTQSIAPHLSHLSDYAEIFIFLGEYPDNNVLAEGEVIDSLCSYLDNGGQIYMEGEDTWWYDPPTSLHDYFYLQGVSGDETYSVFGVSGTFTAGMIFGYTATFGTPVLTPLGTAFTIFTTDSGNSCGVACDTLGYKTAGLSIFFDHLIDSLPPSRKIDLADSLMHFFGNYVGKKEGNKRETFLKDSRVLNCEPNPFSRMNTIIYQIKEPSYVSLRVYDSSGRQVRTLIKGDVERGVHRIKWDGSNDNKEKLSTGVYFTRLESGDFTSVKKVVLVR